MSTTNIKLKTTCAATHGDFRTKTDKGEYRMTKQNRDKKCVSVTFGMLHDWGEEMDRLNKEIEQLKADNSFLRRQNNALKMRCSNYCLQVRDLESEIADMKFTHKMLNSEEAGRAFARELLGKPMSETDIAEEECIANGEAHYNKFAFIGDDF